MKDVAATGICFPSVLSLAGMFSSKSGENRNTVILQGYCNGFIIRLIIPATAIIHRVVDYGLPMLSDQSFTFLLKFSVVFCWGFALMVGRTALHAQNQVEVILKGVIVGIGIWCGLGLLRRKRYVGWFAVGLCFYAIYGSLVWLHYALLLPLVYGQKYSIGLYEYLSFIYLVCGTIIIWFLLRKDSREKLNM